MKNMIDSLVGIMENYDKKISGLTESQISELDTILDKLKYNLPVYHSAEGVINKLVYDNLEIESCLNRYKILEIMSNEDDISQNFLIPKYILKNIELKKLKEIYNSSN